MLPMNICKLFSFVNNIFNLLKHNQFLLKQLVVRNIATRYRGSLLGFFWTLVQPLLMLIVYTFVFTYVFQARWGTVLGNNKGAFAMIMFAGIACFNIFSEALTCCSVVIINYPNFVKKVLFPLELIPLATVISSFIIGIPWFIMLLIGSLILLKVFSSVHDNVGARTFYCCFGCLSTRFASTFGNTASGNVFSDSDLLSD